jgi:LacI family transcriptional regulator
VPKTPTVYDVAQRAGVSIATVSMAFRRPHKVKEATRQIVFAAAEELNYVPSASARGLAHGRTGALGMYSFDVFLPEPDEFAGTGAAAHRRFETVPVLRGEIDDYRHYPLYVNEVQRGVELECWRRGYALLIGGADRADSTARVTDIVGRVDGLAVFPHSNLGDVLERISRRVPVVTVAQPPQNDSLSHVTVDNRGGMHAITEHLIVEHGMRDLLYVGYTDSYEAQERFSGFKAALRAAGLRVPRRPAELVDGTYVEHVLADILARGALPEAFVCVSDEVALDLMKELADHGIRVPQQVAVTGFDGIVAARIARPALTTVRQPMHAMGRAVVDILLERINDPAGPSIIRRLPVQVVLRESCGCTNA